jgi:hypothetical protein
MDTTSKPMSAERLAEINTLTADIFMDGIHVRFDEETAWLAILDLRREVERLRGLLDALERLTRLEREQRDHREAAALGIVRAVANGPHWAIDLYTVQEQARALLAASEGEASHEK